MSQLPLISASESFRRHEILLTGGSGFLGKVILGLLLDRFPDFRHLHFFERPARGMSAEERFYRETLASPALSAIAERLGQDRLRDKVTVWSADLAHANCGVDPNGVEKLAGRVSLIINCAGKVDFFPPVDESFRSNVDGVENVLGLARSLGARLLHVSTCYVRGEADGLAEETEPVLGFYPHRHGPEDYSFRYRDEIAYCRERIRHITSGHGSNGTTLPSEVSQRLVALGRQRARHWGWVNTYTYAKSLGEQIVAAAGAGQDGGPALEYAIVRPAIVESALRFPFPGWIEGGRTAAPLVLMALGGLKDWPVQRDMPLEVVPVDLVAAAILVVAALLLEGRHQPVYQLATADVNPLEMEHLIHLLDREARRRTRARRNGHLSRALLERLAGTHPGARARFVSPAQARAKRRRLQQRLGRIESLLAKARSAWERTGLPGGQGLGAWSAAARALSLQAQFREQTLDTYLPFILYHRYIFESENIRSAYASMTETDRRRLPWDPESIDWDSYWIHNQIEGIERWIQPAAVKDWTFKI
jgi:long-chain acyl-CoA synthetase